LLALLRVRTPLFAAAYVGLLLGLWFMQLFSMLLVLLATTIGVQAYNRRRRVLLAVVVILILVALFPLGSDSVRLPPRALVEEFARARSVRVALLPLRPIVETFTAERVWPDLVQWSLLALAVNAGLMALVIALDAQFLE